MGEGGGEVNYHLHAPVPFFLALLPLSLSSSVLFEGRNELFIPDACGSNRHKVWGGGHGD